MRRQSEDRPRLGRVFLRRRLGQMSGLFGGFGVGQWQAIRRRLAEALSLGQSADTDRAGDKPEPRSESPDLPRDDSGKVDWAKVKPFTSDYRYTWDRSYDFQPVIAKMGPPMVSIMDAPKQEYPIQLGNYADFKEMCYTGRARVVEMEEGKYGIALELVDEIASQNIGREILWTEKTMKKAFAWRNFFYQPILHEAWGCLMDLKHNPKGAVGDH